MVASPPSLVALAWGPDQYDAPAPFSPGTDWPEYRRIARGTGLSPNGVYGTVRESLRLLGLDAARYGTTAWNPLGSWIQPGDTVVLKPNFVREFRESSADHANCVITHGSVIRAVTDYVYVALGGRGRIVIADAPNSDANFTAIRRITGLHEIQTFYRHHAGFNIEVYDLRPEAATKIDGVIVGHVPLTGDPAGYVRVNLGLRSAFAEINHLCHLLYGSEYDMSELHGHQHDHVHEYLISRTVLDADCVISLPKLKTHKKVGLTVNLKNLVGINGNKNWLPHHREGTPLRGGDQFADERLKNRIEGAMVAQFKRHFPRLGPFRSFFAQPVKTLGKRLFGNTNTGTIRSGNWYGNDTTWRMALDLNRILLYADTAGALHDHPQRRFFSVVDGIVGGEGNGPLDPRPKPAGVLLAGSNPVAVDLICAWLMGFDYRRLPLIYRAVEQHSLPIASFDLNSVFTRSNNDEYNGPPHTWRGDPLRFEPHFGWKGHIEQPRRQSV